MFQVLANVQIHNTTINNLLTQTKEEEAKRFGLENQVERNPDPDFNKAENERPSFDFDLKWSYTQIPEKDWKVGSGANNNDWKTMKN
ncbi:uncharacterized protein KGF55_003457 [Candida pseudojiufengensis]|uniref:uncharacterized protein n=1 Tax=Candida pseudojiufengensis TaxID=497109 RepID=UPI002224C9D5|nr:uncharacterized protein KGF55_003457 [Candida pseudojiufengensis]KAI5962381.1 hypothetical protein KGF55_003457 [Candida pseudojiufengensis]